MFGEPLADGEALVFRFSEARRRSVHTLFVRATIDVIWTVKEEVQRVETMRPWTLRRVATADTIIELPAGTARHVQVGDRVRVGR